MYDECHNCLLQIVILVKVIDEANPPEEMRLNSPEDCPRILATVCIKDEHGNKDPDQFKYTEIGKGSNCVQKGMQEFERAIPWTSFFHGFQDSLPQNVAGNNFTLDFFLLRREVVDVYNVRAQLCFDAKETFAGVFVGWCICFVALHCIAYVYAYCRQSTNGNVCFSKGTSWGASMFTFSMIRLLCRTQDCRMPELQHCMQIQHTQPLLKHHKAVLASRAA